MKLGSIVFAMNKALIAISGISLLGIMLLTCLDVFLGLFGHPVLGAEELVSLWAALLLAFALPVTHSKNANVGVDILYVKLSPRAKRVLNIFNETISFALFVLISWRCYLYAVTLFDSGEVSMVLELPSYILVFGISFSLLMLALTILVGLVALIKGENSCQNQ